MTVLGGDHVGSDLVLFQYSNERLMRLPTAVTARDGQPAARVGFSTLGGVLEQDGVMASVMRSRCGAGQQTASRSCYNNANGSPTRSLVSFQGVTSVWRTSDQPNKGA